MRIKVLFCTTILMCSFYGFSQRGIRIGYVDMEYILENVEEYRDATEQLNAKAAKVDRPIATLLRQKLKNTRSQIRSAKKRKELRRSLKKLDNISPSQE